MTRHKILIFNPDTISKTTGLYSGVYTKDIKSFVRLKIANEKKLGRLQQVVKLERDLVKLDRWQNRKDYYGKKQLRKYFTQLPHILNTPIVKQSKDKKTFYIEMERIRANETTKAIQKQNLKDLKINKALKDYLKENTTLKKIIKTKTRIPKTSGIPFNFTLEDADMLLTALGEGYSKFDNIIKDMGGLINAIELYSNTIDRKSETYSVNLKLYSSLFD